MFRRLKRSIALALTPLMVLINLPLVSFANDTESTTEIFHKQIEAATAGERIKIYTEIADPAGVDLVRVYFKKTGEADFVFIKLDPVEKADKSLWESFKNLGSSSSGSSYAGILPALANGSQSFEYLILVKTTANKVFKSQTYTVAVNDSNHKVGVGAKPVQVYTELAEAPAEIAGFSDTIVIDIAESSAKFGVVAGLYSALTSGGEGAVAGGTVAATAGGYTTAAIVVGSVAAVAVVGGVAAVAGGGGSSGSSSTTSTSTSTNTDCSFQGHWAGSYSETSCDNQDYGGSWTGTVDETCYFSAFENGGKLSGFINTSTGVATLSGSESGCGPLTGSASFSGSSVSGVFSGSGVSGSFSGTRQ